jgi:xylan 1,4-beta-xylosidase
MEKCKTVTIKVDAGKTTGELKHAWRYIGYDENNYTHTHEGEELIAKFGKLEDAPYYFRAHHMLCTGNLHGTYKWGSTNAYIEDEQGNPIYNWEVIDEILDIYLRNSCKPFFEIGFMPYHLVEPKYLEELPEWAKHAEYRRLYWANPPKDYNKWYDLVYNLVKHCVERYGQQEVLTWYWELWNEPDISYWRGTPEEFCKLYDYTEAAIHAVLKEARLGGPATTDPKPGSDALKFLETFLDHCANGINYVTGQKGTRLDYVTFHTKGGGFPFKVNAPKETPSVKKLVEQVKTGLEAMNKYGYGDLELVLSEADPDSWAAGGLYDNSNMNFRNTEYYASYVASSYNHVEKVAKAMNADVRPLAWAFMFIGERCFEGTRTFTTQGIDKAVFNLFKMYAKTGTKTLLFESSQEKDVLSFKDNFGAEEEPEISGMASVSDDGSLQVMVYSHHDNWDINEEHDVELDISNISLGNQVTVKHYRIDKTHSNAYTEWVAQSKPKYPNKEQYASIKAKDGLELMEPLKMVKLEDGKLGMKFTMPSHAISFIEITKS